MRNAAKNTIVFDFVTPGLKSWTWLGIIASTLTLLVIPGAYFI